MKNESILVIGACGQIGSELTMELRKNYKQVVAADLKEPASAELRDSGEFIHFDVLNKHSIHDVIKKFGITQIYHLAAILSATGEKNPELAWRINMKGLRNVLDVCVEENISKLFRFLLSALNVLPNK